MVAHKSSPPLCIASVSRIGRNSTAAEHAAFWWCTGERALNNVIVTVFLCLLVFIFDIRAMGTILLDVAPLAAPVAYVFFI